jgi:K+-sensing histidine kinase KdpD
VVDEDDSLMYLSAGMIGAILLGGVLVPLRELTTASNLAFPFLVLTIVIAELGGRRAAVATALSSALSLDFFLTKPYMRLTIEGKHDIIAFAGLAICGLIVAAFHSSRREGLAARRHLELLRFVLDEMDQTVAIETRLARVLDAARATLPIAAAVVRSVKGEVVAASHGAQKMPAAVRILETEDSPPRGIHVRGLVRRGRALPEEGVRLALAIGNRRLGWLEVWGNGTVANRESRRTLDDVARYVSILLASASAAEEREA